MNSLADCQIGECLSVIQLPPVTREQLVQYANVSGDNNLIHTSDVEARKAGFPGIVQQGMLTMGKVSTLFTRYAAEGFVHHYSTRFINSVHVGDELTMETTLINKTDTMLVFEVMTLNQNNVLVTKSEVHFKLY